MTSKKLKTPVRSRFVPVGKLFSRVPYWLLITVICGIVVFWKIAGNESYSNIFSALGRGVLTTLYVSLLAYLFSITLGLIFGLASVSRFRLLRELATFYIEIVRGIPMLVILYYIAFVGAPELVSFANWLLQPLIEAGYLEKVSIRDINFVSRAILALTIGYSAFIAEIFRAGIISIGSGQTEAAMALGMNRWQTMRHIVLPQAIRNVLPPLGNEFVAMIKDSALVSALGVQDITQIGKVYSSSTFKFFETYNVVAYLYLLMTVSLSLLIRGLEKYLEKSKR
jgi:polar amino acid transport system permease protein